MDIFDYELDEHLEEKSYCLACEKQISSDKEYCSYSCYNADNN